MERMVIWLMPEERAALKALARGTQRTVPGAARMLIVEGLQRRGLYTADMEESATQEALRVLQAQRSSNEGGGDGDGESGA